MKTTLLTLTASALCASGLLAATEPTTAMEAIKLLPKNEAKKIARIEAREGTPAPERWYVIAFDEKSESGVREYAVAGGEIVATRAVSQFAEALKPADVIGGDAVRIDSDRAARLAQQYALANNATVATLNYELKRDGEGAAPLWTVTCLDEAGKELGRVVVTAGKGNVVSLAREIFPLDSDFGHAGHRLGAGSAFGGWRQRCAQSGDGPVGDRAWRAGENFRDEFGSSEGAF